ncbi:MAG TPA: hypothetical protein DD730_09310 [Desulfosporosinus sp.]|nr:hypothetical protein [Desulfosporosinus sp.]
MAKLAKTIQSEGSRAILQLCHDGPKANSRINGVPSATVSGKPFFFNVLQLEEPSWSIPNGLIRVLPAKELFAV